MKLGGAMVGVLCVVMLCLHSSCDAGGAATPRAQMQTLVRGMCDCTTPECVTKTRHAAMKLTPTAGVHDQLASLQACTQAARGKTIGKVIERAEALAKAMCACTDKKCGGEVKAKLTKLGDLTKYENASDDEDMPKLSDDQTKRLASVSEKVGECADKVGVELGGGEETRGMKRFATKMCACQDKTCATSVQKEFMTWVKKVFKGSKKKGTKRMVMRWKKSQKIYMACFTKRIR